jgi:hypothetical protein
MVTYTLATPVNVGGLTDPVSVTSLVITGIKYSSTPPLAQLGASTLEVTLTDPITGRQFVIAYQDATAGDVWGDVGADFATAVFAKLLADGKIPAGTVDVGVTAQPGKTTQLMGVDTTQAVTGLNIVGL